MNIIAQEAKKRQAVVKLANRKGKSYTPLYSKMYNRFVHRRILSRRTTAEILAYVKGVQHRENLDRWKGIVHFGIEGSICKPDVWSKSVKRKAVVQEV